MKMVAFSYDHPRLVVGLMVLVTLGLAAFIPSIRIDTDPENMLPHDEPVRTMHREMKDRYTLYDIVVVGVVNEIHPEGVFNLESLTRIYELNRFIEGLREEVAPSEAASESDVEGEGRVRNFAGVVPRDMMAPANMDHIEPAGAGVVRFEWLMPAAPRNHDEALEIRRRLMANEMFRGTIVSEDGKALCLYVPITSKDLAHRISLQIQDFIADWESDDQIFITGLPVAEDTFGVEMFQQMATTAPAAMVLIFILMLVFFRKIVLIVSPLILAGVSVIGTMGLLIGTGNTVHIMSSMIPIFVMPIAVLDSIHVLSEFFDRYQETRDRRQTILAVMRELWSPMLFTSLTSAAGFASLALTPIPPVQVFGIFVGVGILIAWLLTMTFIPAYTALLPASRLDDFGARTEGGHSQSALARGLRVLGRIATTRPGLVVTASLLMAGIAAWGITQIQINDNPVKWFHDDHPIRVADRVLNDHFGGTYMAYLALHQPSPASGDPQAAAEQARRAVARVLEQEGVGDGSTVAARAAELIDGAEADSGLSLLEGLAETFLAHADESEGDERWAWEDLALAVEVEALVLKQPFKRPEVLAYLDDLDRHLVAGGLVGKVNGLPKIVKKINKELHEGGDDRLIIPPTLPAVGQCLLSYQNSHVPERLFHCTTRDYTGVNLWLQLRSGDNKDMEAVVAQVPELPGGQPSPGRARPRVVRPDLHQRGLAAADGGRHGPGVSGELRRGVPDDDAAVSLPHLGRPLHDPADPHHPGGIRHHRHHRQGLRHAGRGPVLALPGAGRRLRHPLPVSLPGHGEEARKLGGGGRPDVRGAGPRHRPQRHRDRGGLPPAAVRHPGPLSDGRDLPGKHPGPFGIRDPPPPARPAHPAPALDSPRPPDSRLVRSAVKPILLVLAATLLATPGISAQAPTPDDIADKVYHSYKYHGDDRITRARMDLRDADGESVMERQLLLVKKDAPDSLEQKIYAYFLRPADIRGLVFMVHKHVDRDDDRWLYLPALDLVKRLAASDKRGSFVGSQFVYEDVTGRNPALDTHELVETTDKYYILKSTPKTDEKVEFAYFQTWADKETFIPVKRVFYDSDGSEQRIFRTRKAQVIQGFPTIVVFSMKNMTTGEETITTYSDLKYDQGIPDDLFTETYLRRRPREWLDY